MSQLVKNPPTMWETWVRSLGWEDLLVKGRLPTPVFWPGEFHGLYSPWGRKESDMPEQLSLHFLSIAYNLLPCPIKLFYKLSNITALGVFLSSCDATVHMLKINKLVYLFSCLICLLSVFHRPSSEPRMTEGKSFLVCISFIQGTCCHGLGAGWKRISRHETE